MPYSLTYVELFAGAGGLSLGLETAGWQCVAHAEWDAFPRRVLKARWPDVPLFGDVSELDGMQFKGVTLLTGGSPCQDLSIAGKRAGMTDGTRSSLFHQQIRLWHECEAPFILWENVIGAFSSQNGRDFASVLSAIVGRAVAVPRNGWRRGGVASGPAGIAAWRVLDAQYFGVPQRRRRVFVLGTRDPRFDPAEILSLAEGLSGHLAASGEAREGIAADTRTGASGQSVCGTVTSKWAKGSGGPAGSSSETSNIVLTYSTPAIGDIREDAVASTMTKNTGGGGETQNPAFVVFGTLQATDATKWGSNQWVNEGKVHLEAGVPRRLTPMECERLMGWPDGWTDVPDERGKPAADTARYKACGNGVASPVAAWIGFRLRAALEGLTPNHFEQ